MNKFLKIGTIITSFLMMCIIIIGGLFFDRQPTNTELFIGLILYMNAFLQKK